MANKADKALLDALIEKMLIDKEKLAEIQKEAEEAGIPLFAAILKRDALSEDIMHELLAEKLGLAVIQLKECAIDTSVIDAVPLKFASYYKFMPVKLENRTLTIAVPYPLDVTTQDNIRTQLGFSIEEVLARESDIADLLKIHYGLAADTIQKIMLKTPKERTETAESVTETVEDIEKLAEDASVVKLVNQIILEGFKKRATDIHIEPYRGKVRLRYRIDGVLYDANAPDEIKHFLLPILSRIKIMSNLNIVERRLPQDGRAVVKIQNQTLDLRVSSIPTPYGESVVIRILPTKMLFSLKNLGLSSSDLIVFESLLKHAYGIIFVTGPTGSGKTTTLYACLNRINTEARKIITIEDPIEYEMGGITQIQVAPEIGLDFARGLRSMLRHDPDVMMVGEVRDLETAEIAIRVALTGHLVFSTLHTNDAASGITRLVDIGLEPYLVVSSVVAFIAQRLVRLICPHCKEQIIDAPLELKAQIAGELRLASADAVTIYRGKGCRECNGTGFYGRSALYEILLADESIRELVFRKASANQIKHAAVKKGMSTLRQEGWKKVIAGETTPEEVLNVTQADEIFREPKEVEPAQEAQEPAAPAAAKRRQPPKEDTALFNDEKVSAFPENQRVFKRIPSKINITYRITDAQLAQTLGDQQLDHFAVTKDVSAGGLLFVSDASMPKGAVLELVIRLPDEGEPLRCLSKIVRVAYRDVDGAYDIAVCFLDLSTGERARFDKFVNKGMGR